jgi:hypothetical protein
MRPAMVILIGTLAACSQGALLVQDDPRGGVVTYLYKRDRGGPMFSPHRAEALRLVRSKCPDGYVITKEGEARTSQGAMGQSEGDEDAVRHRWGLQFTCKGS